MYVGLAVAAILFVTKYFGGDAETATQVVTTVAQNVTQNLTQTGGIIIS